MSRIIYFRKLLSHPLHLLFCLLFFSAYSVKAKLHFSQPSETRMAIDTIQPDLMTFWKELQRAETLLVQTSLSLNQERRSKLFDGIELERPLLISLIRMSSGLNVNGFTPSDYQIRYPFSSGELIEDRVNKLVDLGYLAKDENSENYRLSQQGLSLMRHYVSEIGAIIQSLDTEVMSKDEIDQIISLNHKILAGLEENIPEYGSPIFVNRLLGFQPDYSTKELWHHWQLVWTMLAALADEEEHIRQSQNLDPVVWFARRKIWLIDRMPWLADSVTAESLSRDLQNYAPADNTKAKVDAAIKQMKRYG